MDILYKGKKVNLMDTTKEMAHGSIAGIGLYGADSMFNIFHFKTTLFINSESILTWILIGLLGAAGGFLFKVLKYYLKKWFPCLKKIDESKTE